MRVNVYAEEMTDRIEVISKTTKDGTFTGLRFYLELPATVYMIKHPGGEPEPEQISAPFLHHEGDDDSSAVTFWGKRDLRAMLIAALTALENHYAKTRDEYRAPSAEDKEDETRL